MYAPSYIKWPQSAVHYNQASEPAPVEGSFEKSCNGILMAALYFILHGLGSNGI